MRVLQISELLVIGDMFKWDGRDYQVITNPKKDTSMQGELYTFIGRMQSRVVLVQEKFYIDIKK